MKYGKIHILETEDDLKDAQGRGPGDTGAICIGMMLGYHLSATKEDEMGVPRRQQPATELVGDDQAEANEGLSLDERNTRIRSGCCP